MKEAICLSRLELAHDLPFLNPEQRRMFVLLVGDSFPVKLMLHQIATKLNIRNPEALALMSILHARGVSKNRLLVYHMCKKNVPVGSKEFAGGFPVLPWRCPNCKREVRRISELSFDYMATISELRILE